MVFFTTRIVHKGIQITNANPTKKIATKQAVMNHIWFSLLLISVIVALFNGRIVSLGKISFDAAKAAVELAIGFSGTMIFWLGLVRVAEKGGLMTLIAKAIRPVMIKLFPDVPHGHPAMAAMAMNLAANVLGLGNAATPLGIKAMMLLNKLNQKQGEATNAMCLFLTINTSGVAVLPLGVMALRAASGSSNPSAILVPTLIATACSTLVGVLVAKFFEKKNYIKKFTEQDAGIDPHAVEAEFDVDLSESTLVASRHRMMSAMIIVTIIIAAVWGLTTGAWKVSQLSDAIVPVLALSFLLFGFLKGVPVYEAAIEGGKEGFEVAIKLMPFLVMILVAVGFFRESGAFELISVAIKPATDFLGVPVDALSVALLRTLSGSGAFGLLSEITQRAPDSFTAFLAGTIQGSSETTFYVITVYFGSIGVTRLKYTIASALCADLAGFVASVIACKALWHG